MKNTCIVLMFLIAYVVTYAQKHDNTWLIGNEYSFSTALEFSNGSLHMDSIVHGLPIFRNFFSMSDSSGNLIFYTNGIKINNAQYQLMQNGDSLNPGQVANDLRNIGYSIPSGIISVAHPLQANKYYLFHQSNTYASDIAGMGEHLYCSLMDMNNGLGQVEKKNQILVSDSIIQGQLQMVKHANGRDWWLVQPMAWTNGYYIFLVAEDTILLAHKQYIGNPNMFGTQTWTGQSVFSPDGSKYARYDYQNDLDVFDFDRCTGVLSNAIHIPIQDSTDLIFTRYTGVAISSSSQYLYVSSYNFVYQFDLWASDIAASKDTVAVYDGFTGLAGYTTSFHAMHLAPDSNIYISEFDVQLHTIESPDLGGISCDVKQHNITTYWLNDNVLPNFPHYRTPALAGSPCDTLTSTIAVSKQAEEWEVILYPNPTSHELTIQSNLAFENNASIEIFNAIGQLIKTKFVASETNNITIDASSLLDGIYIMRLKNGENTVTKSFIVSK